MDGCLVDEWLAGEWTDGRMNGWIDGQMNEWNMYREGKHQDFTGDCLTVASLLMNFQEMK